MTRRTICHVDMDAFFVSVELRRRPELVGLPVVVGGTGRRGVVAAASYEARRYGVHSALPSAVAKQRCPQAIFLPGDHDLYASVSADVRAIFERYSPLIEPLSLDEAFVDVTGSQRLFGDGAAIAQRIRTDVADELDLACSVGVAPNKFLAKLASVSAKPRATPNGVELGLGVVVVEPGAELAFLHPLPVARLWGVGPKSLEKLSTLGVKTVGDLAELDEAVIVRLLGGSHGRHLLALAQGIDDRPVEVERAAKSIGHEETYPVDLVALDDLERELVRLSDAVSARLRRSGVAARTVTLKVRFAGFRTVTRSVSLAHAIDTGPDLVDATRPLLRSLDLDAGVRLLGVSASNFGEAAVQMSLLDESDAGDDRQQAAMAIDEIRGRFGQAAIGPASAVRQGRLNVVRKGAQQWGPDQPEPPASKPSATPNASTEQSVHKTAQKSAQKSAHKSTRPAPRSPR